MQYGSGSAFVDWFSAHTGFCEALTIVSWAVGLKYWADKYSTRRRTM